MPERPKTRRLSSRTTLDILRKQAKRRLKALRADDPAATLRQVQHDLAREHGFDGWSALKAALDALALSRLTEVQQIDILLRQAWEGDPAAAARLAARRPDLAKANLLTAIAFGDLAEVERRLAEDSAAANRKAGPLPWEPLLYLSFSRLPVAAASDNAVAIATALLDAGADPNAAFDDGWGNPFKPITGVIGLGEGVRPPHPKAAELVRLFIARGADPFDTQALYDTSIVGDDVTWLDVLYDATAARGEAARWLARANGLDGRFALPAVDYLLGNAVANDHRARAAWLLDHGANPNGVHAYTGRPLRAEAALRGFAEMAALLARHGAAEPALAPQDAFQVATLALDAAAARRIAEEDPAVLASPEPLLVAAEQGRVAAVRLLLDLGVDPDVQRPDGRRALHTVASSGSVEIVRLLIAAGAEVDVREREYNGTPLGFAIHFQRPEMVACLSAISQDVFNLAGAGLSERLDAVLRDRPDRVQARDREGQTALFCLPDDEDAAERVARVLLAHGADAGAQNKDGLTAAALARRRGLDQAADVIDGF